MTYPVLHEGCGGTLVPRVSHRRADELATSLVCDRCDAGIDGTDDELAAAVAYERSVAGRRLRAARTVQRALPLGAPLPPIGPATAPSPEPAAQLALEYIDVAPSPAPPVTLVAALARMPVELRVRARMLSERVLPDGRTWLDLTLDVMRDEDAELVDVLCGDAEVELQGRIFAEIRARLPGCSAEDLGIPWDLDRAFVEETLRMYADMGRELAAGRSL